MNTIVTINSFRRGVGKSSIAANLAFVLAQLGRRVALLDMDLQTPCSHLFFGLRDEDIEHTLNDYFLDKCGIFQAAHDLSARFEIKSPGKLFLIPASTNIADIMLMLREPLGIDRYTEGLQTIKDTLSLDILLVDTHSGLNEDSLLAIAASKALVIVLHPDQQDFQGTAVTVDVARKLQIENIHLVLNNAPTSLEADEARNQLVQTYHCSDSQIMPFTEELVGLASSKLFTQQYPEHPLTGIFKKLAESL